MSRESARKVVRVLRAAARASAPDDTSDLVKVTSELQVRQHAVQAVRKLASIYMRNEKNKEKKVECEGPSRKRIVSLLRVFDKGTYLDPRRATNTFQKQYD